MPESKRVYQYSIEGKFIAEFESINFAAKYTGCSFSGVRGCANGKYSQSCGYIWRYYYKPYILPELKTQYESMRKRFKRIKASKGDRILEFDSISEAANFIGCHRSAISQAISDSYSIKAIKGWSVREI